MAVSIGGTQTGYDVLSNNMVHAITFPSSLNAGELIVGAIAAPGQHLSIYSSSENFRVSRNSGTLHDVSLLGFYGISLGGTNDYLNILSDSSCVTRWITYRVLGHGHTTYNSGIECPQFMRVDESANFEIYKCPTLDDSISQEYLWLPFAAYNTNTTPTIPTDFSNQITNLAADGTQVSITSCSRIFTASQLSPDSFVNSTSAHYNTEFFRISPILASGIKVKIASGNIIGMA